MVEKCSDRGEIAPNRQGTRRLYCGAQYDGFRWRALAHGVCGALLFFSSAGICMAATDGVYLQRAAENKAASAPRPCVIKPVMTDSEIAVCRQREAAAVKRSSGSDAGPVAAAESPVARTVRVTAPKPCEIKQVMTDEEIARCRRR